MFYFLHVKSKCIYTFICLLFIFYFFFNNKHNTKQSQQNNHNIIQNVKISKLTNKQSQSQKDTTHFQPKRICFHMMMTHFPFPILNQQKLDLFFQ